MISPYHTITRELVQVAIGPAIPGCPILSPGLQLWFCNHTPYAIQQICLTEIRFLFYRPYFGLFYSTAYFQIESWQIHEDVADSSYRLGYRGRFHIKYFCNFHVSLVRVFIKLKGKRSLQWVKVPSSRGTTMDSWVLKRVLLQTTCRDSGQTHKDIFWWPDTQNALEFI